MKDVTRVIKTESPQVVSDPRPVYSIKWRSLKVALMSVVPLTFVLMFTLYLSLAPSDTLQTVFGILAVQIVSVPVYVFVLLGITVLTAFSTYAAVDNHFVRPVRFIVAWLSQAQSSNFEHIGFLPPVGKDDFGELVRLSATCADLASQTREANKHLLEEKSLFVTIAAHQLRTPLTGLLWTIDSLLDPQTNEAMRHQLMTDADSLLKRMRLIVNHILASANVEEGKFGYMFEQIDIVAIISKLIEEFRPVADARSVNIVFEHPTPVFNVAADAERISLALFDLMSNAIDYTPAGGTVTLSIVPKGDQLEVAIADTGIGISEVELPHLFTKFYRGERARHMRPDGSGLGLFLVKDIMSSHGSDIAVTSHEGIGSRFSFVLNSKSGPK
ncbi:MAG TPA: HAMP domain-containing sensor histidine kinase [Candidatus Paceibacterota bacterium]|nr:HAMP domain-containing sensor histidine kinase [Candidatus Paceibacterota bacterium]